METAKTLASPKNRLLNTCFLLLCLCLIDAVFTDLGIRHGHIEESNPVMRYLYDTSIVFFYFVKISLPILLFMLMQFLKPNALIKNMVIFAVIIYVVVISIHIYWIIIVTVFLK